MLVSNFSIKNDTDMSASSANSSAADVRKVINYAIQLVCTGSPVGTAKLQISCDQPNANPMPDSNIVTVTNWTDLAGSTQSISAAGNVAWIVQNQGAAAVRVVYTKTSGTGTITSLRINTQGA